MKVFSTAEVAKHNQSSDLWMVINGRVYDVTKYAPDHPGGGEVLMTVAGADGTEGFNDIGHSQEARQQLEGFAIGTLEGATTTAVVQETQTAKPSAPQTAKGIPPPTNQIRRLIALSIVIGLSLVLIMYPIDPIVAEIERLEHLLREQDSMYRVSNRTHRVVIGLGT